MIQILSDDGERQYISRYVHIEINIRKITFPPKGLFQIFSFCSKGALNYISHAKGNVHAIKYAWIKLEAFLSYKILEVISYLKTLSSCYWAEFRLTANIHSTVKVQSHYRNHIINMRLLLSFNLMQCSFVKMLIDYLTKRKIGGKCN